MLRNRPFQSRPLLDQSWQPHKDKPQFFLTNGDLSAYAFGCGYQQLDTGSVPGIEFKLYHQGACFHFQINTGSRRLLWDTVPTLGEARLLWKQRCRHYAVLIATKALALS